MSEQLITTWQQTYRHYCTTSAGIEQHRAVDAVSAWRFAAASRAVATAWRDLAMDVDLPWWLAAAVASAAEAFDMQADDWGTAAHNKNGEQQW